MDIKFPQGHDEVKDMSYDEVYSVIDTEGKVVNSLSDPDRPNGLGEYLFKFSNSQDSMTCQNKYGQKILKSTEDQEIFIKGSYNPSDYHNLEVSSEVKQLFHCIQTYKPKKVDLPTKLVPFVPEYVPSIGEIDAFLKIPRPDDNQEDLGLISLDEPNLYQSTHFGCVFELPSNVNERLLLDQ